MPLHSSVQTDVNGNPVGSSTNPISSQVSGSISGSITGRYIPQYGTSGVSITCTLSSLGSTSARQSTAIDNTTNLYEDALIFVKYTTAASSVSTTGYVNVYGYGSVDGGTTYPESLTGTDSAATLSSPPNLILLGQFTANANLKTYTAGPISFCRNYGIDRLPTNWGLVFVNLSGTALNATGSYGITYQGVNGRLV